jgi:hypothetical protein
MPSSIAIPQIKWGKRKERSVVCEFLTDDGRWVDRELPSPTVGCVADDETRLAFLIDPDNWFLAEDGNWHQLLTEKSHIPLCLRNTNIYQDGHNDGKKLKTVSDELFELSYEQRQVEAVESAKQEDSWDKIMRIVIIVCATILVIVGIRWAAGGFNF